MDEHQIRQRISQSEMFNYGMHNIFKESAKLRKFNYEWKKNLQTWGEIGSVVLLGNKIQLKNIIFTIKSMLFIRVFFSFFLYRKQPAIYHHMKQYRMPLKVYHRNSIGVRQSYLQRVSAQNIASNTKHIDSSYHLLNSHHPTCNLSSDKPFLYVLYLNFN